MKKTILYFILLFIMSYQSIALPFPILSVSDSNIFADKVWWINESEPYFYDFNGYLRFNVSAVSGANITNNYYYINETNNITTYINTTEYVNTTYNLTTYVNETNNITTYVNETVYVNTTNNITAYVNTTYNFTTIQYVDNETDPLWTANQSLYATLNYVDIEIASVGNWSAYITYFYNKTESDARYINEDGDITGTGVFDWSQSNLTNINNIEITDYANIKDVYITQNLDIAGIITSDIFIGDSGASSKIIYMPWSGQIKEINNGDGVTTMYIGGTGSDDFLSLQENGGKVGIGITTPNTELQVIGTINATSDIYIGSSGVCTATNGRCASSGSSTYGWNESYTDSSSILRTNISVGSMYITGNKTTGVYDKTTLRVYAPNGTNYISMFQYNANTSTIETRCPSSSSTMCLLDVRLNYVSTASLFQGKPMSDGTRKNFIFYDDDPTDGFGAPYYETRPCQYTFFITTSSNAATDTGTEVATQLTSLETKGYSYTCLDCITSAGGAATCATAAANNYCELYVNCAS